MASLTRATARDLARLIAQDTNATNPACTDSNVNDFIEEARQWYGSTFPDEMQGSAGTVSLTAGGTLTTTATFRSIEYAINSNTGLALPKQDYWLLFQRALADGVNLVAATTPAAWGAIRNAGGDNSWSVQVYPVSSSSITMNFYGHFEPALLTGDSDSVQFGQEGSRAIARLAALEVARAAGRPDRFLQSIAAGLPEKVQARRRDVEMLLKPATFKS